MRKNYLVVGLILLFLASGLLCYAQRRTPPGKRLDKEIYTGRWLVEYTPLAKLPGKAGGVAAIQPNAGLFSRIESAGEEVKVVRTFKYLNIMVIEADPSDIYQIKKIKGIKRVVPERKIFLGPRKPKPSPRMQEKKGVKEFKDPEPTILSPEQIRPITEENISKAREEIAKIAKEKPGETIQSYMGHTFYVLDQYYSWHNYGQDVIIAYIDTGVWPAHPFYNFGATVLAGHVVDDVKAMEWNYADIDNDAVFPGDPDDWIPANDIRNDPHGTFGAGMILNWANVSDAQIWDAIKAYGGTAYVDYAPGAGNWFYLWGIAINATIYPVKVFDFTGGPTSEAAVIAGMEHVIDQKQTYIDTLGASGLNISVCNMSLGGGTVAPGIDWEDQVADMMANIGINLVCSMGNDGPFWMNGGSPGTARQAITVGAASDAFHFRIQSSYRNWYMGLVPPETSPPSIGYTAYRPDASWRVAPMSSRGPNRNGIMKPDIVANGIGNFSASQVDSTPLVADGNDFYVDTNSDGITDTLYDAPDTSAFDIWEGTSFSAPQVSGACALLWKANSYWYGDPPIGEKYYKSIAKKVKKYLLTGANHNLLPRWGVNERGYGYLNLYYPLAAQAPKTMVPPWQWKQGMNHAKEVKNAYKKDLAAFNKAYKGPNAGKLKGVKMWKYYYPPYFYVKFYGKQFEDLRPAETLTFPVLMEPNFKYLWVGVWNVEPDGPSTNGGIYWYPYYPTGDKLSFDFTNAASHCYTLPLIWRNFYGHGYISTNDWFISPYPAFYPYYAYGYGGAGGYVGVKLDQWWMLYPRYMNLDHGISRLTFWGGWNPYFDSFNAGALSGYAYVYARIDKPNWPKYPSGSKTILDGQLHVWQVNLVMGNWYVVELEWNRDWNNKRYTNDLDVYVWDPVGMSYIGVNDPSDTVGGVDSEKHGATFANSPERIIIYADRDGAFEIEVFGSNVLNKPSVKGASGKDVYRLRVWDYYNGIRIPASLIGIY